MNKPKIVGVNAVPCSGPDVGESKQAVFEHLYPEGFYMAYLDSIGGPDVLSTRLDSFIDVNPIVSTFEDGSTAVKCPRFNEDAGSCYPMNIYRIKPEERAQFAERCMKCVHIEDVPVISG